MASKTLTLQAHWNGLWRDAGDVTFADPDRGVEGPMQFYYNPIYINDADDYRPGLGFRDERAIGVHVPGEFSGHFNEQPVAPILRDIIPQGAGRDNLLRLWGVDRDPGPAMDLTLLESACIAPIGNLRIKQAADQFQEQVARHPSHGFTKADVTERSDELIDYAHSLGIAIGGATGAAGDAPKLLMAEGSDGRLYLEGTLADDDVVGHWLIKFPRGRRKERDRDVLRCEGMIYQALEALGIDAVSGAELHEGDMVSLWLPRFDRLVSQGQVERLGVESVYSLNQMLGNGATMQHTAALDQIEAAVGGDRDTLLAEYLTRDAINTAIGNSDNHGRNTAVVKQAGTIRLAPAYDLAPMVLDPEGIARTTLWPEHFRNTSGHVDYRAVIRDRACDPAVVLAAFQRNLARLATLDERMHALGVPQSVTNHPRVNFDRLAELADDLLSYEP
ncbi:serine/threonine-protein kinase HipA [Tamilnaduibacter salinus]|uniref:Serine/threonine-protein kinase HipA n=1 Tax=Tamilnaduibacter salinus TaxID=1484056 RepID=A0A2U1CX71_9GAMM|nr:HipA domain-containing protein [Tamilnaduibacter salinus]PVY76854.1 serine/threonine-protein kinase HipA [Tamilnaduibacter salinus]